ncbi:MAG: hypothetical protein JO247_01515 [Chloroflexi bacterium]|nr:hypothetical protein [Chloroflexota bacterium]
MNTHVLSKLALTTALGATLLAGAAPAGAQSARVPACLLPAPVLQAAALAAADPEEADIDRTSGQLDEVYAASCAQATRPLRFSANLVYTAGGLIAFASLDTLERDVDALAAAGAGRIDINPSAAPFLPLTPSPAAQSTVAKYVALADYIRNVKHLQLAVNPEYVPSVDSGVQTVAQWQQEVVLAYPNLVRLLHPDLLVLLHEPTTMATRMGKSTTPEQWQDFVAAAAQAVGCTPNGQLRAAGVPDCSVGGLDSEYDFLKPFTSDPYLNAFGIDIYTSEPGQMERYADLVALAHNNGKPAYVEEMWRQTNTCADLGCPGSGVGEAVFQPLDQQFLETMSTWASAHDLEWVTPFWTNTFYLYVPEGVDHDGNGLAGDYIEHVLDAINAGARTDMYRGFSAIVRQFEPPLTAQAS